MEINALIMVRVYAQNDGLFHGELANRLRFVSTGDRFRVRESRNP